MVRFAFTSAVIVSLFVLSPGLAGHYMNDVYPSVRKKHPNIISATNNYMISVEEKKIARAGLMPTIELETEASYFQSQLDNQETKFQTELGSYLTFEQPVFDISRWYSLARGKQNEKIVKMQQSLMEQQFLMTFGEGLLRVSQGKTRYFFSRQNLEYFKTFFEKEKAREQAAFAAANPGQEFKWRKSLTLLTLDQDLRAFERNVDTLRNAYMAERVAFEESILQGPLDNFIMVNPFIKRQKLVKEEVEVANYVRAFSPAVLLAKEGVELSDINLREAKKLRWPKASLFVRTGISSHGSDHGSDRFRDDMIGIQFSVPLFEGFSIRRKQNVAGYEKNNSEQKLLSEQMAMAEEARKLYQRIELAVTNIESLIASFEASKVMVNTFLTEDINALQADDQLVEPATNADRKRIMDTHFAITRDLALEQHVYLTSLLRLYFLQGNLDVKQMGAVEDRFFIKCDDYEKFINLVNKTE